MCKEVTLEAFVTARLQEFGETAWIEFDSVKLLSVESSVEPREYLVTVELEGLDTHLCCGAAPFTDKIQLPVLSASDNLSNACDLQVPLRPVQLTVANEEWIVCWGNCLNDTCQVWCANTADVKRRTWRTGTPQNVEELKKRERVPITFSGLIHPALIPA